MIDSVYASGNFSAQVAVRSCRWARQAKITSYTGRGFEATFICSTGETIVSRGAIPRAMVWIL